MAIVTGWKCYVSVQPPIMMLIFAMSMSGTILTDLIVYRTCTVVLNINKTECLIINQNGSSNEAHRIDILVQSQVNLISMSKSFVENLLPAFLSFFVGPWSDKYGRKPLLLAGYTGYSLTFCLLSLMTMWDINPWYLLIAYMPSACFGGLCIILLASFSYISDISLEKDRTWHLAYLEILISLGLIVGIFIGPYIFKLYGYPVTLSVAAMSIMLANIYVLFFVSETVQYSSSRMWSSLFDVSLVKDLISTCIKKRDGFDRCVVWCCIMYLILYIVTMDGDMSISYLFSNARFGWDVSQYSNYMGANVALGIIGTLIGIKIIGSLKGCLETGLVMLASISSLSGVLMKAFAWQAWHMYLSVFISMFGGISGPAIRSILSKLVPSSDAGKVFSLITSIETTMPFAAASLYTTVYSHYLPPIYPSPVWLISCVLFIIMIILLICIHIRITKMDTLQYRVISEESE
ncbi:proton-coupled folate transporter-like isoform X1 [Vespa mandarinia]|uniref:proton-coupled folate transporter-like isoform X1 n=2 Tax=Vespa mandarinia TaxID=7446 RepID=UPI0016179BD9|nr:proton-coupled folate transporter-like isoform X1 [Vespa mandarinia]